VTADPLQVLAIAGAGAVAARGLAHALRRRKHPEPVIPRRLYPWIDPARCISSGGCISACPEGDVLAMIDGVPRLVDATACVGHADCVRACCVGAVELRLGSSAFGVEIPVLDESLTTLRPRVYVAGELGGIGLIHNAIAQGIRVIDAVAKARRTTPAKGALDVAIVGAGPAGLAATLRAKQLGLTVETFDRDAIGGAIRSFPRHKLVMTTPFELPLYGRVRRTEISKEELCELWSTAVTRFALPIHERAPVAKIRDVDGAYDVETAIGTRRAEAIVIAIGRRGTPRRLGVRGEGLPHVRYELLEPAELADTTCVVFGGGDSAVEAAIALAAQPGAQVTLVHRSATLAAKPANQARLRASAATVLLEQAPTAIEPDAVVLARGERVRADHVFVMIGGELPGAWLRDNGIATRVVHDHVVPT
jgi:thioredoxin reductase/NAD-dependent dihydropyrimidine dehydrogenase PreA subunit